MAGNAALREAELDELMARLARGDRSAFDPLYAGLRSRAARLVASRVDASYAADVVQSAMLNVFSRASEFTPGRPCLPWFYAVVANEVRSVKRREQRFVPAGSDFDLAGGSDPESLMIERELDRALERAVETLDEESHAAICALLGRSPAPDVKSATLRKRVSRAYAKLRLLLGGHDGG